MVNLFNKYGSIDENSDTESSDDDYSGNTDESGDENSDKKSSDDDYSGNTDESGDETQNENTTRDGSSYMITNEIINESMVDMPESGSDTTANSTEDDRNS